MNTSPKIFTDKSIITKLQLLKGNGSTLVFTNGCFDLLHPGHVAYLAATRSLGDFLIVGVNDDASVGRLKGPQRPINNLQDRMIMLAALESVDAIISFSEDTPSELIQRIEPHILVKGGDYKKEDIVGADQVEAMGGKVIIIPFEEGYSSTRLIEKIHSLINKGSK